MVSAQFPISGLHGQVTADLRRGAAKPGDSFCVGDHPFRTRPTGDAATAIESRWPLRRVGRIIPQPGTWSRGQELSVWSRRQGYTTFGLTSNSRATLATDAPISSRCIAASVNSFVNSRQDKPMTPTSLRWHFHTIRCILSLNRLSQKWGQVHSARR